MVEEEKSNENKVFINISGGDAQHILYLLQRSSSAYNEGNYPQWLHILSSIHERIFHRIAEDDETLDVLYKSAVRLQGHWNRTAKHQEYGWAISGSMFKLREKYTDAIRDYSRAIMLELNTQGFFPNKLSMSETRLE